MMNSRVRRTRRRIVPASLRRIHSAQRREAARRCLKPGNKILVETLGGPLLEALRSWAQILILAHDEAKLVAQVGILLVERCGSEEHDLTLVPGQVLLDGSVAGALAVAQVVKLSSMMTSR